MDSISLLYMYVKRDTTTNHGQQSRSLTSLNSARAKDVTMVTMKMPVITDRGQ